jgi:hypothetical protein
MASMRTISIEDLDSGGVGLRLPEQELAVIAESVA